MEAVGRPEEAYGWLQGHAAAAMTSCALRVGPRT